MGVLRHEGCKLQLKIECYVFMFSAILCFLDAKLISCYNFLFRKSQYLHLCPPRHVPAQYLVFKRGGEGGYRLPATNRKLTLLFAFNPKYFSDLTQNISQINMKYFSDRTNIFLRLNQNISQIGPKYFSDWNNKFKSKGGLTGNQPQTDPDICF